MKKLKTLGAILSMTAFLGLGAGCGGDLVKKIDKLADEACACKDMKCAEAAQSKLLDMVKDAKEPSKGDQGKRIQAMEARGECMSERPSACSGLM